MGKLELLILLYWDLFKYSSASSITRPYLFWSVESRSSDAQLESDRLAGYQRNTVYTIKSKIRFYDFHRIILRVDPLNFCLYCLDIIILTNCSRNQDAVYIAQRKPRSSSSGFRSHIRCVIGVYTSKTIWCHNEHAFIPRILPDCLVGATYSRYYRG